MTAGTTALGNVQRARVLLVEAATLDEVLHIRGIAQAAEAYFRTAHEAGGAAQEAAEVRIRAERKAGELLAGVPRTQGFAHTSQGETNMQRVLADNEIARPTAHRWQKVAQVPEDVVDAYTAAAKATGEEITTAGLGRDQHVDDILRRDPLLKPPPALVPVVYAEPQGEFAI